MHRLALSIVLTSQGISFLHAGTEFLRSKKGVENSFESPDSINAIDWNLKSKNHDVVEYVKALIKMRKEHPAFRMRSGQDIAAAIRFLDKLPGGVVAYTIDGVKSGDKWKKILVCFNGTDTVQTVSAGNNNWYSFITDNQVVSPVMVNGKIKLLPRSCSILYVK